MIIRSVSLSNPSHQKGVGFWWVMIFKIIQVWRWHKNSTFFSLLLHFFSSSFSCFIVCSPVISSSSNDNYAFRVWKFINGHLRMLQMRLIFCRLSLWYWPVLMIFSFFVILGYFFRMTSPIVYQQLSSCWCLRYFQGRAVR